MLHVHRILRWAVALLVAMALGLGCGSSDRDEGQSMADKSIEQVQAEHTADWMAIDGVIGTAIGLHEGRPCIKVLAAVDPEQLKDRIPSNVEGYPVLLEYTGEIRALDEQ